MSPCVFCDILAGRLPGSLVYQDEHCYALMDIQPVNAGHLLVIPIRHAESLTELDADEAAHLLVIAQQLAKALWCSGIRMEGLNLFLADGEAAGQDVFHVHLHLIPRYRGDGFGLRFGPEYGRRPPRDELDALTSAIRQALASDPS